MSSQEAVQWSQPRPGTPTFSIITICRNDRDGLERTITSVQGQSLADWEHILVDGGSTDTTLSLLAELEDERVRWSSAPDRGIYDAMNKGLAQARGEFIMLVNSGDALTDRESLAVYLTDHRRHGWAWAYGAIRLTDVDGEPQGAYIFDPFKRWRFNLGLDWIPFASVCLRRELVDRIGVFRLDAGNAADQEFLMRAAKHSEPRVITWFLADYALGGLSQTVQPRARELAWHRMRVANGTVWRGSRIADRVLIEFLALRKPARMLASRIGRA